MVEQRIDTDPIHAARAEFNTLVQAMPLTFVNQTVAEAQTQYKLIQSQLHRLIAEGGEQRIINNLCNAFYKQITFSPVQQTIVRLLWSQKNCIDRVAKEQIDTVISVLHHNVKNAYQAAYMAHCTHRCIFFDSQIADDHRICDEGEPYVFLDEEWLIPCCNRHAAGRATDPENDNRMTPQQIIDYYREKNYDYKQKAFPKSFRCHIDSWYPDSDDDYWAIVNPIGWFYPFKEV